LDIGAAGMKEVCVMDNPLMRGPAFAKTWGVLLTGFFAIVTFIPSSSLHAANLPAGFTESQFGGLGANMASPTAMAFAPDGRLFICTQGGSLYVIKNGVLLGTPFLTVPVDASGERGLLGVAIPADFAVNPFVYIYYTTSTAPIPEASHNSVPVRHAMQLTGG
jgi:hypothetical protein